MYLTRGEITLLNPLGFYNVKVNAKAGSKDLPERKSLSCRPQKGKSKLARPTNLCVHVHMVILAGKRKDLTDGASRSSTPPDENVAGASGVFNHSQRLIDNDGHKGSSCHVMELHQLFSLV